MAVLSHSEGQSHKSRGGTAFQREVGHIIQLWLEMTGLNEFFTLGLAKRIQVTALGKTIFLKPDFVLYYKDTKIIIALIGVKKSWRERYKIDDRDCILLKIAYPDLVWIDMTHKENTNTTIEKEKDMIKKVELDSFFDFICSTYVVESQEAMFDALENHLRSLLPTNK